MYSILVLSTEKSFKFTPNLTCSWADPNGVRYFFSQLQ